jgi:ketosteroid isomerase-like protein
MFYEAEYEFQIAARSRGADGATFHRAPQPRRCIPLVTHHSLAQELDASEASHITTASRILIVTPRLEFPANSTKQTLPPISNRYKMHFFHLGTACTGRFAAAPSSLHALLPSLKNLIANLELEFSVNPIRITKLEFPNRKFVAILSLLSGGTNLGSQATISNLQTARRIRDTSADNASLRAFPRCYASCGFEEGERMKQNLGGFAWVCRRVAALIAILVITSSAAWAQKKPKNKAADQSPMPKVPMSVSDEIDKDISEMLAAFQLGKVEMMHKYYSDNAVFVSGAFAPPIVGWQNYVEDYKRSLAAFQGMQLIRRNTDVFVHGDIAWASYQWEFLSSYQNKPYSAHGQTTLILQKIGDGWLIVHNHTSQVCDQVPEQPQQPQPAAQNPTAPAPTPAKPRQ